MNNGHVIHRVLGYVLARANQRNILRKRHTATFFPRLSFLLLLDQRGFGGGGFGRDVSGIEPRLGGTPTGTSVWWRVPTASATLTFGTRPVASGHPRPPRLGHVGGGREAISLWYITVFSRCGSNYTQAFRRWCRPWLLFAVSQLYPTVRRGYTVMERWCHWTWHVAGLAGHPLVNTGTGGGGSLETQRKHG